MSLSNLFRKRMLVFTILILMLYAYFGSVITGVNKTVAWAWDFMTLPSLIDFWNWPIYIIGYGFLTILKIQTNAFFSGLHLIFMLLILLIDQLFGGKFDILMILQVLSMIIFLINIGMSIKLRKVKTST